MDSTSHSDGGGGLRGRSSPLADSPVTLHDEGGPQQRPALNLDAPPDPGSTNRRPPHAAAVLSLDQIRISGSSNEYTEGPTVAQRSPAAVHQQQKSDLVSLPGPRSSGPQNAPEEEPNDPHNLNLFPQYGSSSASVSSREESQGSIRSSAVFPSSGQRLAGSPVGSSRTIRTQPTRAELNSEELKPLNRECRSLAIMPGSQGGKHLGVHGNKCEDCGRCRCPECSRPRVLPSCWMCGRRCVCSVQSAVEYGTCVCCVKGLFYHCSSDDEDTCADKPFSCTQSHCCVRWTTVSLLSLLFPCLLCYLPAKGCVAVCQSCYDRVARPGCRCRSANPKRCEDGGKLT
ncbi:protein sprouty homolog 2 [Spinachia spinachia]